MIGYPFTVEGGGVVEGEVPVADIIRRALFWHHLPFMMFLGANVGRFVFGVSQSPALQSNMRRIINDKLITLDGITKSNVVFDSSVKGQLTINVGAEYNGDMLTMTETITE